MTLPACTTAAPPAAPARRRFRAVDVAANLDMVVIGDVCVGVSLTGYRAVLGSFLDDAAGSRVQLLDALDMARAAALPALAHALRGAASSLGLRGVQDRAGQIERDGAGYSAADCAAAAAALREQLATARALLQRMGFL